ncbi:hypothetical protein KUTeg_012147 [Tegillarca granosa]|uniref:UBZ2-type domain-containing protein n=1 Tax=Tegillarca granosa TaxID=220873 RepID=A0ABQ9EYP6_TEGGR|nr:hypothetical protein KUTeg_012147 [Tegillarca granosa]
MFKDLTKGHGDTRLVNLQIDRGMSWDSAMIRFQNHNRKDDGFYKSKREMFGKTQYLLATLKENSTHVFRIARPNTGLSQFEEEKSDLLQRYAPITPDKAEKGWQEQYERTKNQCMHGSGCKTGRSCKVGSRCYSMHLLCGSIVTIMSVLESTLNKFAAKLNLSKSEATIRVVRVKLDDGERVVGIRYPELLISEVEKVLKEQKAIENIQRSQMNLSQSQTGNEVCNQDTEDSCPIKTLTVEPVSPVNEKCLRRARRPPVTIKNFFKPAKQKAYTVIKSDSPPEQTKISVRDVKQDIPGEQTVKTREMSQEQSEDNKHSVKVKCTRNPNQELNGENETSEKEVVVLESDGSNHGSETLKEEDNKTQSEKIENNKNQSNKPDSVTGLTSIKSRKRPATEVSSSKPNKRAKQATIFSSFAKVEADNKEKVRKAASCPICGKEFDIGTSNADINSHIDNCLIE